MGELQNRPFQLPFNASLVSKAWTATCRNHRCKGGSFGLSKPHERWNGCVPLSLRR